MVLPLALTLGEPAGIGPDITLAVWQRATSWRCRRSISSAIRTSWRGARGSSA